MSNQDNTKINIENFSCLHASKSNYSVITPGQHLVPINGKIFWHVDESSLTQDMEKYKTIFAFEQAFNKWAEVIHPITFQPTGNISEAQIVIKFKHNGQQGLPYPFEDTTLAYAFAPQGTSLGIHSDMYFNDEYKWDEMHKPDSIYLFKVAVHEIGHTLNLGHQTEDINDIMYPMYQPNGNVVMNTDTRKGIYDLYKNYGVSLGSSNLGEDIKDFISFMYNSRNNLLRLTTTQINFVASKLGISFAPKDNLNKKITTLLNTIKTL